MSDREFKIYPDMVGRLRRRGAVMVADNATVVGDVTLGEDVGIWFGVTIRSWRFRPVHHEQRGCHHDLTQRIGDRVHPGWRPGRQRQRCRRTDGRLAPDSGP